MKMPQTPPRADGPRADAPTDKAGQGRDARLKAALKANLARRKAQAKARQHRNDPDTEGTPGHG